MTLSLTTQSILAVIMLALLIYSIWEVRNGKDE